MDTNVAEIDQSLDALDKCYTYSGPPDGIDNDKYLGRDLDWKMLRFGELARSRVLSKTIFSEISQLGGKDAAKLFARNSSMVEFIWFLFGQRNWNKLYDFFKTVSCDRLKQLPVEISDIYILTCLRSVGSEITTQSGKQKALQRLADARNEISVAWPDATVRHEYFRAISAHVGGNVDWARVVFAKIPLSIKFAGPLRAVFSILTKDDYGASDEFLAEFVSTSPEQNVVLISLDRNYYRKYFFSFQSSLKTMGSTTNDRWGLHIHCVGFDPRNEELQPDRDVGVTVDRNFQTSEDPGWKASYAACARFIFCERYLQKYRQIFICDVDGIISEPLSNVSIMNQSAELLLCSRMFLQSPDGANPLPWNSIAAGNFAIRQTDGGLLFAKTVGAYLTTVFRRKAESGWPWFADQNALFYSYLDTKTRIRVGNLDRFFFTQGVDWRQFSGQKAKRDFIVRRSAFSKTHTKPPPVETQGWFKSGLSHLRSFFRRYFSGRR